MRRIGEVLGTGYKQISRIIKIRAKWSEIAGEVLAAHAEPVVIKNKVLHLMCDSPAWVQQAGMLSPALPAQIKKISGIRVEKVEGKFGHVQKMPKKSRQPLILNAFNIDPEDVNKVKNPELAHVIRQLIGSEGTEDGSDEQSTTGKTDEYP